MDPYCILPTTRATRHSRHRPRVQSHLSSSILYHELDVESRVTSSRPGEGRERRETRGKETKNEEEKSETMGC